ncbi:MAG: hypothetical protein IPJ98_15440 [Bryobacterales bacterium]|nr:hypothetical protein [Bryobacterales bacterium]
MTFTFNCEVSMRSLFRHAALPAFVLLLIHAVPFPALAQPEAAEESDPPEVTLGERLFLETRFAQAFKAFLDRGYGVNNPEAAADPVMESTVTTAQALPGPFAGASMNCRACHMVDEHAATAGGGMRSYADFARKSPVPLRLGDPARSAPHNSPSLVNASLSPPWFRSPSMRFASIEDLVRGTFTGRNLGWLPSEEAAAVAHIARIIREDNGQDNWRLTLADSPTGWSWPVKVPPFRLSSGCLPDTDSTSPPPPMRKFWMPWPLRRGLRPATCFHPG